MWVPQVLAGAEGRERVAGGGVCGAEGARARVRRVLARTRGVRARRARVSAGGEWRAQARGDACRGAGEASVRGEHESARGGAGGDERRASVRWRGSGGCGRGEGGGRSVEAYDGKDDRVRFAQGVEGTIRVA